MAIEATVHIIIIICVIAAVLGGAAFLLMKTAPEEEETDSGEEEVTTSLLYDKAPGDLAKLTVENEKGTYEVIAPGTTNINTTLIAEIWDSVA